MWPTPHSEKHRIVLPSGAQIAFTRPGRVYQYWQVYGCWVTFRAAINTRIPFFVTELENMNNATFGTCSQDIFTLRKVRSNSERYQDLRVARPTKMWNGQVLGFRWHTNGLETRFTEWCCRSRWCWIKKPGSRDLEGLGPSNDNSILNCGRYKMRARAERDQRRCVLVDFCKIH